jgi:signal transduction histidine kinase
METNVNILVIDDEDGIRRGCRRVLEPQGFKVATASSFHEGLQRIQNELFDLILVDVMMPDGHGVDLLVPIQERDPETVAVIITGYATAELAVDAIRRGAYDFISKPFTADLLLITVHQGLEKRRLSLEARRLQGVEKKAAELALAKEHAEHLNEFKSFFATMVAHELRSPVAGAQSLVRTMLRGLAGELTSQQSELLGRVNIRLDFLLALINDLLTLASSKSLETDKPLQAVSLQAVVKRVLDRFAEEAHNKQIDLKSVIPSKAITVAATEDGLDSILRNLIGNAIKYTPEKGQVRVEVNPAGNGSTVQVSVSDTGIGISVEDLPHIGEEFFRTKTVHQKGIPGTGLGMSIVKQYVERFNGELHIESQENQGTTFSFNLSLWQEQE